MSRTSRSVLIRQHSWNLYTIVHPFLFYRSPIRMGPLSRLVLEELNMVRRSERLSLRNFDELTCCTQIFFVYVDRRTCLILIHIPRAYLV